jgi:pyruvate,water dikinase
MNQDTIVSIDALGKGDVSRAGGKGANLGELTRAGVKVPPGFVVTADAYFRCLGDGGIGDDIARLLSGLDESDSAALDNAARAIQSLVRGAPMSGEIVAGIREAYENMGGGLVAVRSSATAEDLAEASFAGQQSTYLNVEGEAEVIDAVHRCWASLFEARAIHYRAQAGFDHLTVGIAVVVQSMVQAERSGVMFTINPVTNDTSSMIIEAVYGLGEAVVAGMVTPDMYIVDKSAGAILDKQVEAQEQEMVRRIDAAPGDEPCAWVPVAFERRAQQKITDEQISELAAIGIRLERYFGGPQDIEWASEGGTVYIVQARPVTTAG